LNQSKRVLILGRMKKIFTVVGARPQFIKAAVVSRAIRAAGSMQEYILHTGQHYDDNMSDIFFREMSIPLPDFRHALQHKTHGSMTGEMLTVIEEQLVAQKPDTVLIYGDTNSTLAAALAASKLHIPVAHVEAGMRSFDKRIPEEINRIVSDHVSDYLFCTTDEPSNNLRREGIDTQKIHTVGDVMYDAVLYYQQQAQKSDLIRAISAPFYLATIHRQENTNDIAKLKDILHALQELSRAYPVILPLHPRTKHLIDENNINTTGIQVLPPLGYFDILCLLKESLCVITDSGGLQREAYYMSKPCVVVRDVTEWKELVEVGVAIVTGTDQAKILNAVKTLSTLNQFPIGLYGNGHAGEKIAAILR
jgi:UDP-GlcNAc3NAcA epimerase